MSGGAEMECIQAVTPQWRDPRRLSMAGKSDGVAEGSAERTEVVGGFT
jgi:hypothetical protein